MRFNRNIFQSNAIADRFGQPHKNISYMCLVWFVFVNDYVWKLKTLRKLQCTKMTAYIIFATYFLMKNKLTLANIIYQIWMWYTYGRFWGPVPLHWVNPMNRHFCRFTFIRSWNRFSLYFDLVSLAYSFCPIAFHCECGWKMAKSDKIIATSWTCLALTHTNVDFYCSVGFLLA